MFTAECGDSIDHAACRNRKENIQSGPCRKDVFKQGRLMWRSCQTIQARKICISAEVTYDGYLSQSGMKMKSFVTYLSYTALHYDIVQLEVEQQKDYSKHSHCQ